MSTALILCGGKGTRIRSLYPDTPKILIPVAGRPVLFAILDMLRKADVDHVHLAGGHLYEAVEAWVSQADVPGMRITSTREPQPLGTAGGVKYCEPHLPPGDFWVLNGDSILPALDTRAMQADFSHAGPEASLAVTPIDEPGRFGTVEYTDNHQVTAFLEKQPRDRGQVNGGVYLMKRSLLDRIPAGTSCSLERDVFPALAAEGQLRAFPTPPPLLDLGTPDGLSEMEAFLRS